VSYPASSGQAVGQAAGIFIIVSLMRWCGTSHGYLDTWILGCMDTMGSACEKSERIPRPGQQVRFVVVSICWLANTGRCTPTRQIGVLSALCAFCGKLKDKTHRGSSCRGNNSGNRLQLVSPSSCDLFISPLGSQPAAIPVAFVTSGWKLFSPSPSMSLIYLRPIYFGLSVGLQMAACELKSKLSCRLKFHFSNLLKENI